MRRNYFLNHKVRVYVLTVESSDQEVVAVKAGAVTVGGSPVLGGPRGLV